MVQISGIYIYPIYRTAASCWAFPYFKTRDIANRRRLIHKAVRRLYRGSVFSHSNIMRDIANRQRLTHKADRRLCNRALALRYLYDKNDTSVEGKIVSFT